MAEISPNELRFRFQLNKQLPSSIAIHNPTGDRLAFKVKTTTPKKYVVRPSSGVVEPRSTANVQVIMQAQKEYPADMAACKDKFLVQTEALPPGEDIGPDTFKKSDGTKLRVVVEGPPAPPSPVPEVNEGEDDGAAGAAPARAGEPGDLAAENRALRRQLEQTRDERDAIRRQLNARGGGAAGGGVARASALPSLLAVVLAAVLAFFMGHYLKDIQAALGLPPLK